MSWDPHILRFVALEFEFVEKVGKYSKYRVINKERTNAELGILTLTDEEFNFLTTRNVSDFRELVPYPDEIPYRRWVESRLTHPEQFRINGRRMSTYSVSEQIELLNAHWNSGKEIAGPFTD